MSAQLSPMPELRLSRHTPSLQNALPAQAKYLANPVSEHAWPSGIFGRQMPLGSAEVDPSSPASQ
jgi:hypothetical protein